MSLNGLSELVEQLTALAEGSESVGSAAVCAAAGSMCKSMQGQMPFVRDQIGFRQVRSQGGRVRAVVGFGLGLQRVRKKTSKPITNPRRSDGLRRQLQSIANSSASAASESAQRSADRRINLILE